MHLSPPLSPPQFRVNNWAVAPLSTNPMVGVSGATLIACGARVSDLIVNDGEWWRLITAVFLHTGVVHLCFNLAVLLFIGRGLEKAHGHMFAAGIFLVGGIGGNVLSAIFLPQYISVGASGPSGKRRTSQTSPVSAPVNYSLHF